VFSPPPEIVGAHGEEAEQALMEWNRSSAITGLGRLV